ncbi:crotonase/enoyl-CoA hydratase family protein [uncultured Roseibium sp.]|uniref:crotonase/enoyl-CoA hydratase family protein n=1 Tax=uncultured Roseibium sp. TaxID=1936171 RepID=UPI0032170D19
MSGETPVRVEKNGPVTTVILSRPHARNAVDDDTANRLYEAFLAFDNDPQASVAVFWGEGGAFCAGYDLKAATALTQEKPFGDLDIPRNWSGGRGDDIAKGPMGPSRLSLYKPVIAAISGPAVAGGMELALWCDMRVMEESAYMGVYCRRWGVPLVDGGTIRLPRLVGMGRAMDLILTGRKVEADEAQRIGLCERVVANGTARQSAEELAAEIARFPQGCLRADRASALDGFDLPLNEALIREWQNREIFEQEGLAGASRFSGGAGRGGKLEDC